MSVCGIAKDHILLKSTCHNLEEVHFTDERVGNGLEYEYRGICTLGINSDILKRAVSRNNFFNLTRGRSREGLGDCVKEGLDTPILYSGAAEYRNDITCDNALVDSLERLFLRDRLFVEELIHKLVARLCDSLEENCVILVADFLELVGNRASYILTGRLLKGVNTHLNKVSKADNGIAVDNRNLHGTYVKSVLLSYRAECLVESRLAVVKAVNEECLGYACLCSKLPCKLGSNLYTCFTVNDDNSGVSGSDTLSCLSLEIEEAGRVENIYFCTVPKKRCGCR